MTLRSQAIKPSFLPIRPGASKELERGGRLAPGRGWGARPRPGAPARVPCLQWAPQDGSHPSGRRGGSRWQKRAARRAGAEQPAAPAVRNVLENHLPGRRADDFVSGVSLLGSVLCFLFFLSCSATTQKRFLEQHCLTETEREPRL